MKFAPGDTLSKKSSWRDPNVAYRPSEQGLNSLQMQEGRELWRDTAPLAVLEEAEKIAERPRVVHQFSELIKAGILPKSRSLQLELYGLRTEKAKYVEWQRDRLTLPIPLILHSAFGIELHDWMKQGERAANCLVRAISYLHPKRFKQENESANNPKAKVKFNPWEEYISEKRRYELLKKRIAYAERRFWEALRPTFEDLLHQLAGLEVNTVAERQPLREAWRKAVERTARNTFERATAGLDSNAHALERITRARRSLESGLKQIFDPAPPGKGKRSSKEKTMSKGVAEA